MKELVLSQDELHNLFDYDPETGILTNKIRRSNRALAGARSGTRTSTGYRELMVNKTVIKEHRLIWFYVYGYWPTKLIDHINGIRDDNRIINLREASHLENARNSKISKANVSGVKGISWDSVNNQYRATIRFNGATVHIGRYDSLEEAEKAYTDKAKELHEKFYNGG